MPNLVPPVPLGSEFEDTVWQQFFETIRRLTNNPVVYQQPTDPGTSGVQDGTWGIWKNTTSGDIKLWVNDGGIMKSVLIS